MGGKMTSEGTPSHRMGPGTTFGFQAQKAQSPETGYEEGGKQGGLDLVARSVGNLASVRQQGNHDMAQGLLDQGVRMMDDGVGAGSGRSHCRSWRRGLGSR
ncbi:hypothetical protein LIA77_08316 [Sarocladium implicatum]|nr:hypothetical protein LIA77_08316 [Sarocladium implicatum]